jgi:hypothetical protein
LFNKKSVIGVEPSLDILYFQKRETSKVIPVSVSEIHIGQRQVLFCEEFRDSFLDAKGGIQQNGLSTFMIPEEEGVGGKRPKFKAFNFHISGQKQVLLSFPVKMVEQVLGFDIKFWCCLPTFIPKQGGYYDQKSMDSKHLDASVGGYSIGRDRD